MILDMILKGNIELIAIVVPVILFALTIHEYWHARAAYLLDDDTAALLGRLTLNPMAHLDPIGTLALVFLPIGWAKPVPYNPLKLKRWRWSEFCVAAAGPLSNFATALIAVVLILILRYFFAEQVLVSVFTDGFGALSIFEKAVSYLWGILTFSIYLNLILGIFNLIPIPPLDGSKVLYHLLPLKLALKYSDLMRHGNMILIGLIMISYFGDVPIFAPVTIIPKIVANLSSGVWLFR